MAEPAAARRRILVAEDDDAARTLIARYLDAKGYSVTAVADGQAVLDALAGDGPFDMLLLDVMMPRVGGLEVLTQARARGDTTPIIMATAAASPDDVVRALSGGADDYVTKPFSFPVLMARMELRLRRATPITGPVAVPAVPRDATFDASDAVVDTSDARDVDATPRLDDGGILRRIRRVADRLKQGVVREPVQELVKGSMLSDRYLVGDKIGEGGFGIVFRARHVDLAQDVAIKVLHRSAGTAAIESFRREAQNACRVRHPNAVRVFDFGMLPGASAYLVMDLLEGPSLELRVKSGGRMAVTQATPVLRGVLSALAAAHKQGLVHRDVKPQNVVLHQEGGVEVPKLLDFGIAKLMDEMGDTGNVIMGSAAYIAPERLRGEPYDGRTDVYACGIMLYRMLTARYPFDMELDDFENLALWHMNGPIPVPSQQVPTLSAGVDAVVARLLERDPKKRPTAEQAEALVEGLIWE